MLDGLNKSIDVQLEVFEKIISKNKKLMMILDILESYALENPRFKNWYVGAGGVNQTIFNYYHGYESDYGIKDYDIVYFDEDTSYEAEDVIIKDLEKRLKDINVVSDIKNEARVHIWYNPKYGTDREPYTSCEDAVSSWGSTVTCIGIRKENGKLVVYCPYGLNDLFSLTIRPVKRYFDKESYVARCKRWKAKWEKLNIVEW